MDKSLLLTVPEYEYRVSSDASGYALYLGGGGGGGRGRGRGLSLPRGGDGDEEPAKFKVSVDARRTEVEESLAQVTRRSLEQYNSMKIHDGMDVTETGESVDEVIRKMYKSMMRINIDFEEYTAQVVLTSFKMYNRMKDNSLLAPYELAESVAEALLDLEQTNQDLKDDLKDLYINSATQINVSANCKAIVIRYPYKLNEGFRKIHANLVRELEKKFSGNVVVLIGRGKFVAPSRHCFAVLCDDLLSDIVYPAEVRGSVIIPKSNGSECVRYYLNSESRNDTEDKLEAFAGVYKKLCWRDVEFDYI